MRIIRRKKGKFATILSRELILIIISIIFSIVLINIFNKKMNKIILPMEELKLKRILTDIINDTTNEIDFSNDYLTIIKNKKNEIKMINYEPNKVRKIVTSITEIVRKKLNSYSKNNANNHQLIDKIPIGIIFENSFLNSLGPRIKIKTEILGNVMSNIETEVKPYGINNAYIETRVNIEINAKIYLPFTSKNIKIINKIPLAMNVIEGNIPKGYITKYK